MKIKVFYNDNREKNITEVTLRFMDYDYTCHFLRANNADVHHKTIEQLESLDDKDLDLQSSRELWETLEDTNIWERLILTNPPISKYTTTIKVTKPKDDPNVWSPLPSWNSPIANGYNKHITNDTNTAEFKKIFDNFIERKNP